MFSPGSRSDDSTDRTNSSRARGREHSRSRTSFGIRRVDEVESEVDGCIEALIASRNTSMDLGSRASAQSVAQVARLSRNVCQPHHVLANEIAGHKAKRRPGAGEEWFAATKYDWMEVEPVLIDKTEVGQASCQFWSGNFNLPSELRLQPPYHRLEVIPDKPGVGTD